MAVNPAILMLFLFPLTATACGIFDIKSCFTGGSKADAEEVVSSNSQNIALLQAPLSPNRGASSTVEDLSIVEGIYISPENQVTGDIKTIDDEQISVYVVRQGDTLPVIAKMFGVTINTIRWGNDLKSDKLTPGQTLVILPISGIQHVVKSGDTLQSIAKLHKGDLDEILQYNNLTISSKLVIGDVIVVPDGEAAPVSAGTKKTTSTKGGSTPTYSGYYMRPIVGGIKTQGVHGHNGVDLASSYGANVLASAGGEVIIARVGWNGGYGTYVVIKHGNGTQTLYGHLSSLAVSPGDRVVQGQIIGKMGSTGKSTGTHLHFEIRGARNPF
ncbi:MAG: putative peptidase [Parcubacteria bacterium C7867-003]|nr:MAG: putative peptidase [Parcubacteria bacterium C7867-003]